MTALTVLFFLLSGCNPSSNVPGEHQASAYRALSLSALQTAIRSCPQTESCPEEVLQLGYLKRIIGVVSDENTNDLILLGEIDPDLPPLYLDDFVVALRNVWLKYAPLRGNVYQYAYPGCSIDPRPQSIRNLEAIEQQIYKGSPDSMEQQLQKWRSVCEQPQQVSVLGMPFNTQFASTMVKADYDLKTLADGSDAPEVPGFVGITEMISEKTGRELTSARPISIHSSGMNRFWFYPGELVLEADQGITVIKQCQVNLLTERMYLSASGSVTGAKIVDPYAQIFADNFTALYDKISYQRQIYRKLESLFRFVAVANLIKSSYSQSNPRFDANFLADYKLSEKEVAATLPGRHAVKELKHREETERGYKAFHLWIPTCGGVNIAINLDAAKIHNGGRLSSLKEIVIKARKSVGQIFWDFADDSRQLGDLKNESLARNVNSYSKEFRMITVEDKGAKYKVCDGDWEREYPIQEISELWKDLDVKAASDPRTSIYLSLIGVESKSKIDALATSLRLQARSHKTNIQVRLLPRMNGSSDTHEAISLPGIALEKTPPAVEEVREGQYTGWSRIVVKATAQVRGMIKQLVIHIYVKSPQVVQRILEAINNRIFNIDFRAESLLDFANGIRKEMKAYGAKDDEIDVELENEFGEKYYVWLRSAKKNLLS